MESGLNTAGSQLPIFQRMRLQPGSTNTTFWLSGCNFRGSLLDSAVCGPMPATDRAERREIARWRAKVWMVRRRLRCQVLTWRLSPSRLSRHR
jgi:hypothetical protein